MRNDLRGFLRLSQYPLAVAAVLLPITLWCCQGPINGLGCVPQGLLVLGIYLLLAWLCLAVPGKYRLAVGVGCAVVLGASAWAILPEGELLALVPTIAEIALLLWGLQTSGRYGGDEIHYAVYLVGVVLYLAYYAVLNVSERPDKGLMNAILLPGFLLLMLLAMLMMNRISMASAANKGKAPEAMRRRNTLMTVGLMLVVTGIAAIPALSKWAVMLWDGLVRGVMLVLMLLMSMTAMSGGTGSGGGAGGSMDLSGLGEAAEPSLLSMILEKALYVLAIAVVVFLVLVAVRTLWRLIRTAFRSIMAALKRYTDAAGEDYVDEVESTREDDECERAVPNRRKRSCRVDEGRLSPRERVRYRYQRALEKHGDWSEASTAREHLNARAAELYERARYSEHEVTALDADTFAVTVENKN